MQKVKVAMAAILLVAVVGATGIAADMKSGLQPGDHAGAYNVKDITGPNAGKTLCYRWAYKKRPVVNIFTRNITDSLASLVKNIDKQVDEDKIKEDEKDRLAAFVVYLTDDPDAAEKELKAFAEKHNIKNIPLTVFDGIAGPPKYKISKDADVTVMMWKSTKVAANHAFAEGKLNKKAVKEVASSTSKILE